jgi:mevalonate pyrophosphate decarboxylase
VMGRVDSLIATGNTMARSLVEDFSMSEIVCLVSGSSCRGYFSGFALNWAANCLLFVILY